jgi:hypothetical protein
MVDKFLSPSDTLPFVLFMVPFSYVNGAKYSSFLAASPLFAKILGKGGQNPAVTGAWGEEICQFYSVLVDQCDDIRSGWHQRLSSFWNQLFGQFALLTNGSTDPSLDQIYGQAVQSFDWTIRQKLAQTEKYYRKISRDLKRKAGPWCKDQETPHFKIWPITDSMFRRVFMKPNYNYDKHQLASLKRDESTAAEAELKFQKWRAESGVEDEDQEQYKEENELSDVTPKGFAADVDLVKLHKQYPGRLCMNDDDIMFNSSENTKAIQFSQSDIEMVLHRSVLHRDSGLEFFLASKRSYFFYFDKLQNRTKMLQILKKRLSKDVLIQTGSSASMIQPFTDRWRQGLLSNYEYLIYVNLIGGRSFNDLSQYPVFPWVLCSYTSDTLDLNDETNYRNLAKPIGTLNEERLAEAIAKYEMLDEGDINKCHYRMHYSNLYYVVLYLVRLEPYTTVHIEVNDGKFDKPGRLFWSIERTWRSVTSRAPDFRELIPEFFTLPDFLLNTNDFDLGPNEGSAHGHVILPPWAKGSPHLFIDIHRQALESEYVSRNLPQWIDLIFGFRQNGPEAIAVHNLFLPLSYPSTFANCKTTDSELMQQVRYQTTQIGTVPRQLWFNSPHPQRDSIRRPLKFSANRVELLSQLQTVPRYLYFHRNCLYVLGRDCTFSAIPFPKVRQNFQLEVVSLGSLDKYLNFAGEVQKSKSFAFLPDPHRFISGSVVDDTFHVFKVDSNSISHWASVRQGYALLSTIHCAGGALVLTSLKDSSLSLWNVSEKPPSRIYRQTPHLTSIVDIDTCLTLGIIASLDKNRKCVFSALQTGQFVKQFEVEKLAGGGKDESPSQLLLFAAGYVAILSDIRTRGGATTTLRLYGINTGKLGEFPLDGVSDCCKAEFEGGLSALTLAFENGRFMLIAVPQFRVLMDVTIEKPIASVHFMPQYNGFLVATVDREICLINLE